MAHPMPEIPPPRPTPWAALLVALGLSGLWSAALGILFFWLKSRAGDVTENMNEIKQFGAESRCARQNRDLHATSDLTATRRNRDKTPRHFVSQIARQ
ncbi:hypothetical protein [Pseudothioclava arenosa]|uniref:hypothetical protein n=1 Tax=Pseudothioclava arenosa TaxID=1795308 RepID=UPI0015C851EC|nr:hypothetical protein [Pseudothioclava arenosa]